MLVKNSDSGSKPKLQHNSDLPHTIKLRGGAIVTQCRWRGRVARRELRKPKLAARETGSLKEAKDKLEKHVEELTLRLQLGKSLRADLEEAKLQHSLQAMQSKIDETNVLLIKEREAAKKAIEEAPPVIKETPVFIEDTKKVKSLRAEVDSLKACGDLVKQKRVY